MLVSHRIAGLLALWLALSSCDPSPFDDNPQRNAGSEHGGSGGKAGATLAGKGGSGGRAARDSGTPAEQDQQSPDTGAGAGGSGHVDGSNAGASGAANGGRGGRGGRGGGGGASGSAGAAAPVCQRADINAAVQLRGVQEVGAIANPKAIALRVPGPISWIGGKLVWLFPKSIRSTNMIGADAAPNEPNAALVMGSDPTQLEEDLDPDGAPRRFLTADNDNPGLELWPTALLRLPPPENEETSQGIVFVRRVSPDLSYDVWTGHVARNTTSAQEPLKPLFTGKEAKFSTGGFRGNGYAYLFACAEDTSVADRGDPKHFPCKLARAKSADIEDHDGYRVYDPDTKQWVADLSAGGPVIFGPSSLLSLSFNNYLGRFLAVYSRWFSDDVVVQSAEVPWGPWREEFTISLPKPADNVVQAALEQYTLTPAADCAKSLWISYLSPTASTNGYPSAGEIKLVKASIE